MNKTQEKHQTNQTTEGLRKVLFKELDMFLNGDVDGDHVKAVTSCSGAILATVAKDIEATKLLQSMKTGADQPKSIADLNLNLALTNESTKEVEPNN